MDTYYKIERSSMTGRKFEALERKCQEVKEKMDLMRQKYGYENCYTNGRSAAGGIAAVVFNDGKTVSGEAVDLKLWKTSNCGYNTYAPRLTGKGREIHNELKSCGEVDRLDFNEVMGINNPFHLIGFSLENDVFVGVTLDKKKSKGIPEDAIEITASEYEKMFLNENSQE